MKTTLVAVRLERTREVLRELLRSLKRALPILIGVAGPVFVASLALLAWAGVPPMKAATLPWRQGLPLWLAQVVLAAWPLWALRRRLLPEAWCVQLRCLPIGARAALGADLAVSAAVIAPLAALYALSAVFFAIKRPAWWLPSWAACLSWLAASWLASCLLGAAALAWQRRGTVTRAVRAMRDPVPDALLAQRPTRFAALSWSPWWRGALTPGGASISVGMASALVIAALWTIAPWPVVPGAVWALTFCAWLVVLTERMQRAMDAHVHGLSHWLDALPLSAAWRWQSRLLVCAPMALAGLAAVAMVLLLRPWRALPLAAFAAGLLATPLILTGVPSTYRETHVGLWAVCIGVLTALGSELWN